MSAKHQLWYNEPARDWFDALPLGNGRLGAMIYGGVAEERWDITEVSVWSGEASSAKDCRLGKDKLKELRDLFFVHRYAEGEELAANIMKGEKGNYGTHLPLFDLRFVCDPETPSDGLYRRQIDLNEALSQISYTAGQCTFSREAFVSNPDQALVSKWSGSKPAGISFFVKADVYGEDVNVRAEDNSLIVTGKAYETKHSDGKTGVSFYGCVKLIAIGGHIRCMDEGMKVEHADEVYIFVDASTSYYGNRYAEDCEQRIHQCAQQTYMELKNRHIGDYKPIFEQVELVLGDSDDERMCLPTNERLSRLKEGERDLQLQALFFQYGRYLMLSASRENSPLPAHLQGIWNDRKACKMAWTCDYHLDINTQMNYWPAEVTALGGCHRPLLAFIETLAENGKKTAAEIYGSPGWVAHIVTNIWGYTTPGWSIGWGIFVTGGVWMAAHLWDHYEFTRDVSFLETKAYPVLKGAAEFFLDHLTEHPQHGWLVTGPSNSPENRFLVEESPTSKTMSMGPTAERILVYELFTQVIQASTMLNVDEELRDRLIDARSKLSPLCIGKHGQLMEWLEDYEEAIPNHRHTSHLLSLYPFNQITPRDTPELAQAAKVSIERRLNHPEWQDVEWSRANMILYYARLEDGDRANESLRLLLAKLTAGNLLTFSPSGIAGAMTPIFAMGGNSGAAAGVAEMLLQSHRGEIHLLPALPLAWDKGFVKGLRARGGCIVDIEWEDGSLKRAVIHVKQDQSFMVRVGEEAVACEGIGGCSYTLEGERGRLHLVGA